MKELEIDSNTSGFVAAAAQHHQLISAIGLASDQGQGTWLTENGKNIAAIVPADLAEYALRHGYLATGS